MTIKKVLFQLNQLGYGGTEKAILSFAEFLDRKQYEVFLFYWDDRFSPRYYRLKFLSLFSKKEAKRFKTLYQDRFAREEKFLQVFKDDHCFHGRHKEFHQAIQQVKPDILHLNRGTGDDFFIDEISLIDTNIKVIECNIFGQNASEKYIKRLDRVLFISHWLKDRSPWAQNKAKILYNPILEPHSGENLREELNIPLSATVLGRACRPDLTQDDFLEKVYAKVFSQSKEDIFLLSLGPAPQYSQEFQKKYQDKIKILSSTTDEKKLSRFYNSLDIFTHRRPEGETFGMIIAEAMMHSIPVVSHRSPVDNAQIEILGDDSWVSDFVDADTYANHVLELIKNVAKREELGRDLQKRALKHFSAKQVARELEAQYKSLWL